MSEPTPTTNGPEASRLIPPLCAMALFLWLVTGPREPAPAAAAQDTSTASDPSSSTESDRASQRLSLEEHPESTAAVALTELLLEAHRSFHARDSAALSLALESILLDPERSLELLDGLAQGRWTESDLPLSAAEDGARLAVGAGAALYSSDESPTEAAFSERFLGHALTSLLKMRGGLAELMARELARAEVEGERVFGARWLPRLLHLRWKHPERSALFDPLLEAACSDEDADGALLARLLLSGEEDPGLLRVALGRLLLEDPLHWMSVARDWFDRARDIETRAALASAVATSAPLEEASRFFADVADPELTGELRALAERDGGTDELEDLYEERLLSEDDPIGRRAVVSGLLSEPDLCLGIARTDPDAGVRGQALLTATADGVSEEALDILHAAWRAGDDPYYGVAPRHLVWASANAALHATEELRPAAVDLLRSLALDPTFPAPVRWDACRRLQRWLPLAEQAALETELTSSLPEVPVTQETP